MRAFVGNNRLFTASFVVTVLLSLAAVRAFGFAEMVQQNASQPERLKDVTFRIWESYPPSSHGFLTYMTLEEFRQGGAYANHSTAYLLLMYGLYKAESAFPSLSMRALGGYAGMLALVAILFVSIAKSRETRIGLLKGMTLDLSVAFMVTMPAFWISVGRFNVDNSIPIALSLVALLGLVVFGAGGSTRKVALSILVLALFSPTSAVLCGAFLVFLSLRERKIEWPLAAIGLGSGLLGAVIYVQPILVARLLGKHLSNSSWMFRSGLDGDASYFSNVLDAVIRPYYDRPVSLLAVPAVLLFVQVIVILASRAEGDRPFPPVVSQPRAFFALLFAPYMFMCLLWPQAVSIHPYLFDFQLVAPVCLWISLNFFFSGTLGKQSHLWAVVLMFLVSFNLQQVAQASCEGCFYPKPTPAGSTTK